MFSTDQDQAIRDAIAYECDRQHVGEDRREFLYSAYSRAAVLHELGVVPQPGVVLQMAGELEPSNKGQLRTVPVTFADGGYAVPAPQVPRAYYALFESVRDFMTDEDSVRYWVKEFLLVHPFTDGNGRAAWLLYNWMRGSITAPARLPYFFNEG